MSSTGHIDPVQACLRPILIKRAAAPAKIIVLEAYAPLAPIGKTIRMLITFRPHCHNQPPSIIFRTYLPYKGKENYARFFHHNLDIFFQIIGVKKYPDNFYSTVEKSPPILLSHVKGKRRRLTKKLFSKHGGKSAGYSPFPIRTAQTSGHKKGGTAMAEPQKKPDGGAEEIRDILIAISVVAKRLATKLEVKIQQMQEEQHDEGKRTVKNP